MSVHRPHVYLPIRRPYLAAEPIGAEGVAAGVPAAPDSICSDHTGECELSVAAFSTERCEIAGAVFERQLPLMYRRLGKRILAFD